MKNIYVRLAISLLKRGIYYNAQMGMPKCLVSDAINTLEKAGYRGGGEKTTDFFIKLAKDLGMDFWQGRVYEAVEISVVLLKMARWAGDKAPALVRAVDTLMRIAFVRYDGHHHRLARKLANYTKDVLGYARPYMADNQLDM